MARHKVQDFDQCRIFVDGVVEVPDLSIAASVRAANKLPEPIVSVMANQQNRLAALKDFQSLNALSAQKPMPHPPRTPVTFHDVISNPPHERQVLMSASLVRRQIWTTLRHLLERSITKGERIAALVLKDRSVERSTARIADADPNRKRGNVLLRPGDPAERIRGQLAPRADELTKSTAIHACNRPCLQLGQPALYDSDIHAANLADT